MGAGWGCAVTGHRSLLDIGVGLALLTFTLGLAVIFLYDDAPMHALQQFGIAAAIAWWLPERRDA